MSYLDSCLIYSLRETAAVQEETTRWTVEDTISSNIYFEDYLGRSNEHVVGLTGILKKKGFHFFT